MSNPTSSQMSTATVILFGLMLIPLITIGILHGIGGKATDWDLLCWILVSVFGLLTMGANGARKDLEAEEAREALRKRTRLNG